MKKPWTHYVTLGPFTAGFFSAIAMISLLQDYLGKAEFIESVQNNWTPSYITIPCALFLILWGHLSYLQHAKQQKNRARV